MNGVRIVSAAVLFAVCVSVNAVAYERCAGDLHSHCGFSDGVKLPQDAYDTARNQAGMCFWALSDHVDRLGPAEGLPAGTSPQSEWDYTRKIADEKNADGKFVTLAGYEWGTDVLQAHINVFNTNDLATPDTVGMLRTFVRWIAARPESMIGVNHPAEGAFYGQRVMNKLKYIPEIASQTVYIAVNSPKDFEWYWRGLNKGWRMAPSGQQDDHNPTWGMVPGGAYTVMLVGARTRGAVLDAMASRRFYATDDLDLVIDLTSGGLPMGSVVGAESAALDLSVSHKTKKIKSVKLMTNGGTVEKEWAAPVSPFKVTQRVAAAADGASRWYVLLAETEDGRYSVSAPIWVGKK